MEEQIVAGARENSHLIESVRASTTVKLMGREAERENAWRNLYADVADTGFLLGRLQIGQGAAQGLITDLQIVLVVYLGAGMIISGEGFSIGMLFAFMSFRQTLIDRTLALIDQAIQFRQLGLRSRAPGRHRPRAAGDTGGHGASRSRGQRRSLVRPGELSLRHG